MPIFSHFMLGPAREVRQREVVRILQDALAVASDVNRKRVRIRGEVWFGLSLAVRAVT